MTVPNVQRSGFTLAELAARLEAELHGDGSILIERVSEPLEARTSADLALAMQPERLAELHESRASAAVLAKGMTPPAGQLRGWIGVTQPRYALARLLQLFESPPRLAAGIHPTAVVEASARIAPSARIGALSYIGEEVEIGDEVLVLPQVSIAAGSSIGPGSILHPGVRIGENTCIGCRVIIHGNTCIGAPGFSYATPGQSSVDSARTDKEVRATNSGITRIPSLGRVVIEDDVEIGAGCTIDRATLGTTRIGRGSKLDNQVLVAHNSVIGQDCLIAGQTGIAGSCHVGDRVVMGGQVGIADHIRIGDDAVLAAAAGIAYEVPPRAFMIDSPALPYAEFTKRYRALARLHRLLKDFLALSDRVLRLEKDR